MGEVIEAVFSNTKEKKEEVDMFIYNFLIKVTYFIAHNQMENNNEDNNTIKKSIIQQR